MASDDRYDYQEETREERRARRAREKKRKKKILLIISLIVVILAALIIVVLVVLLKSRIDAENNTIVAAEIDDFEMTYVGEKTEFEETETTTASSDDQESSGEVDYGEVPSIDLTNMISTSGIMLRLDDGATVFDYNSDTRIYPASMTKMLTTITAIENIDDLSTTYTFDGSEFDYAYSQGATAAGFYAGDTLSMLDILYGVMLPSGADACIAVAYEVAGSEEAFVALMNQKAQEIGMTNSNFTNCTGLHDENLYTTCGDMLKLLQYSLQNETFRTIFTTHVYTTSPTNSSDSGIVLSSTTFTYISASVLDNGTEVEGGKTGFTDQAGHCLASLAREEDGIEYIMVTAGAFSDTDENPHLTDAVTIYSQLPGTGQLDTSDDVYSGDDLDFGETILDSGDE